MLQSEANPISSVPPSCLSCLSPLSVCSSSTAHLSLRDTTRNRPTQMGCFGHRDALQRRKGKGKEIGAIRWRIVVHGDSGTALPSPTQLPASDVCQRSRAHPALRARWSVRTAGCRHPCCCRWLWGSLETVCTSERRHTECENFADDAMRLLQLSLNTHRESGAVTSGGGRRVSSGRRAEQSSDELSRGRGGGAVQSLCWSHLVRHDELW